MQNLLSEVFQLLRWKHIQNNESFKIDQSKKKKTQNLSQILRYGFELIIQNSETALKSQSMHLA